MWSRASCVSCSCLQGHIYYHFSSGHYTYEPDLCVLRRLERDEAQACMADVGPVLFAGACAC